MNSRWLVSRSAILALVAATAIGSVVGAETDAAAQYVAAPPPALRHDRIPPRPYPDAFWIGGYWTFTPRGYVWQTGHWEPRRAGFRYVQPRWVHYRRRGWLMQPGYWTR
jgi:hypothetical protein